jgi:hypothetical protein
MNQAFVTILTGILIAGATSWITVQLSLRKFRSEKWWERKADAYTRILDALHKSKKFSDEHLEAEYRAKEVSEDRDKELRKLAKESREELLRAVDVGAFLLCGDAVEVLKDYEREVDKLSEYETWYEYIDADNTINHRTLLKLIPIARKDLNT